MQVTISFRPRRYADRTLDLGPAAKVADVLQAVAQSGDHTLVVRAGVPIAEDEALADGDALLLLSAFSGG